MLKQFLIFTILLFFATPAVLANETATEKGNCEVTFYNKSDYEGTLKLKAQSSGEEIVVSFKPQGWSTIKSIPCDKQLIANWIGRTGMVDQKNDVLYHHFGGPIIFNKKRVILVFPVDFMEKPNQSQ